MHIADTSVGMLGASGVVGSGEPLALGAALAAKQRGTQQVAVNFFGDGAMGQGVVYECLNMAAIWKLPLIFVCENNRYAESTPVEYVDQQPGAGDARAAASACRRSASTARTCSRSTRRRARRWRARGAARGRRSWSARPTATTATSSATTRCATARPRRRRTTAAATASCASSRRWPTWACCRPGDLERIAGEVGDLVDAAVRFAETSPMPDLSELETDVYTPARQGV